MTKKYPFDLVRPHDQSPFSWEYDKAEKMFGQFVTGNFSYDEMSNHPDYLSYATAEVLTIILPLMIDEWLARKDRANYLIYPMMSAIDPYINFPSYAARTQVFASLADSLTADRICKFVTALKADPPVPIDRLDSILDFWRGKQST